MIYYKSNYGSFTPSVRTSEVVEALSHSFHPLVKSHTTIPSPLNICDACQFNRLRNLLRISQSSFHIFPINQNIIYIYIYRVLPTPKSKSIEDMYGCISAFNVSILTQFSNFSSYSMEPFFSNYIYIYIWLGILDHDAGTACLI